MDAAFAVAEVIKTSIKTQQRHEVQIMEASLKTQRGKTRLCRQWIISTTITLSTEALACTTSQPEVVK